MKQGEGHWEACYIDEVVELARMAFGDMVPGGVGGKDYGDEVRIALGVGEKPLLEVMAAGHVSAQEDIQHVAQVAEMGHLADVEVDHLVEDHQIQLTFEYKANCTKYQLVVELEQLGYTVDMGQVDQVANLVEVEVVETHSAVEGMVDLDEA